MAQRNPMNDRYQNEKSGKTRKSSASAKPKSARAATLRDPAPKSKKQKKQEARERERAAQEKAITLPKGQRFEDSPRYKKLRRTWWMCIIGAILVTAISVLLNSQGTAYFMENPDGRFLGLIGPDSLNVVSMVFMFSAYGFIIVAFYMDLGKIRKERKLFNAAKANDNSKQARREQKLQAAAQREQEKKAAQEAAEASTETEGDGPAKPKRGPASWFRRGKAEAAEAKEQLEEKAAAMSDKAE